MSELTIRRTIRQWWRTNLETEEAVNLDEWSQRAAADLRDDPAFLDAFVNEMLLPLIKETGRRVLGEERSMVRAGGGRLVTAAQFRAEVAADLAASTWARWTEYDAGRDAYYRLTRMTRPQLLAAAAEREKRGHEEYRSAHFLRLLAGRMTRDDQAVETVWSGEEMTAIYQGIEVKAKPSLRGITLRAEEAKEQTA